jgi:LPS sulfotransferase NodH
LRVPHFAETAHQAVTSYWRVVTEGLNSRIVGFKLPRSSIDAHPQATELLEDPGVEIIRLSRQNRLAQYVSVWLAIDSGVWHSSQGRYTTDTITVNVDDCRSALDHLGEQEAELDEFSRGHPVFSLSYEELVAGERLEELQTFLGVEPHALSSNYRRLRERPLRDLIENFDELAAALEGTAYATYLDEDLQA